MSMTIFFSIKVTSGFAAKAFIQMIEYATRLTAIEQMMIYSLDT